MIKKDERWSKENLKPLVLDKLKEIQYTGINLVSQVHGVINQSITTKKREKKNNTNTKGNII